MSRENADAAHMYLDMMNAEATSDGATHDGLKAITHAILALTDVFRDLGDITININVSGVVDVNETESSDVRQNGEETRHE